MVATVGGGEFEGVEEDRAVRLDSAESGTDKGGEVGGVVETSEETSEGVMGTSGAATETIGGKEREASRKGEEGEFGVFSSCTNRGASSLATIGAGEMGKRETEGGEGVKE